MKCYTVAELEITDRTWVRDYVRHVTRMVGAAGGRYLARTSRFRKVEGTRPLPQVVLLIEWPSQEAALAFYESAEYRPYRHQRLEGAASEMLLVDGVDDAREAGGAG